MHMREFFQMLRHESATFIINSLDIIVGDFNYCFLKVSPNKLLYIFTEYDQMVNEPTIYRHPP